MSCTYIPGKFGAAPLWHRVICRECRRSRRTDRLVAFALACRNAEVPPDRGLARTLDALDLQFSIRRPLRLRIAGFPRRVRRPMLLTTAGVTVLGFGYLHYIDIDPKYRSVTRSINGVNARYYFTHAAALLKEENLVAAMLTPASAPNSPTPGMMGGTMSTPGQATASPQEPTYTLEQKAQLVGRNAPALSELRKGLRFDYAPPPEYGYKSAPHLATYRAMARLLRLEAEVASAKRDWKRAVASGLDALELGVKIQQNGAIIDRLAGHACAAIARPALWRAVDHLNAGEARAAALRLQSIMSKQPSLADTLAREKDVTLAGIRDTMQEHGWRWRWDTVMGTESTFPVRAAMFLELLPYSKTRLMELAEREIDIATIELTGPYVPLDWNAGNERDIEPRFIDAMLPVYGGLRFTDGLTESENGLLAVCLALRAYRIEHGSYPTEIGLLSSQGYLNGIPRDPFGTTWQGRLKYRPNGNRYVLYGVGPDAVDNGGAPAAKTGSNGKTSYRLALDSVGDIVAGVNTQ